MLRAYALADLFSANLDSVVEGLLYRRLLPFPPSQPPSRADPVRRSLATTSGSLVGLSPQIPAHVSKRIAVLGALTWRFHWASVRGSSARATSGASTASSSSSPAGLTMATAQPPNGSVGGVRLGLERTQPLPVLRSVVSSDGSGLQELTVQCNDRLCSLEYVKEGLVVGAFSKLLRNGERRQAHIGPDRTSEDETDEGTAAAESDDDDESSTSRGPNGGLAIQRDERDQAELQKRMARLLAIKASAMAEYLREELKDFKMPAGLE